MGLFQSWLERQEGRKERRAIERRNAERRALCVEFSNNKARQGAIIARLAELNHESDIRGAIERISYELEGIDRRMSDSSVIQKQAEMMRVALNQAFEHDHFPNDLKNFRNDYCGKVKV